jgi:hypothetical protein
MLAEQTNRCVSIFIYVNFRNRPTKIDRLEFDTNIEDLPRLNDLDWTQL